MNNNSQKVKAPKKPKNIKAAPNSSNSGKAVIAPVAQGIKRVTNEPNFKHLPHGDIIVSHREYLVDIAGSVAFSSTTQNVNPGLSGVFPWLSSIAARYESYRFEALRFDFETQAATSTTGTVLFALDYDASDSAPLSKAQAMSYRSSSRSPPWANNSLICLKEDISKRQSYFVRTGSLGSNSDVKLYDIGNLFVCTQGQAGATAVGELYVDYIIRLMTPQIGSVPSGLSSGGYFVSSSSSNAAPFGTTSSLTYNLSATGPVYSGTTSSQSLWTFTQPWSGIVYLKVVGTGLSGVTMNGTAVQGTAAVVTAVINAASTELMMAAAYSSVAVGQTIGVLIINTTITAGTIAFGQAPISLT